MAKSNGSKQPIFKKWWFWIIVVLFILLAFGSSGSKTDSKDKTSAATETATTEAVESNDKEELKKALKEKEDLHWFGDVRNDVTGKWRLSEYVSSDSLETFAADYYNAYFESDDEIHAVINMSTKVTGSVTKLMDDTLDVTLYDYVEDEEHDAKALFGGTLLKEYWVTISTGEIEEIQ